MAIVPAVGALLLALVFTALAGAPAAAVDDFRILSPAADATLTEVFTITVEVDASDGELIDRVDVQLAGPTNRVYELRAEGPPDVDGVQRWSLDVEPLGDQPLRNGRHRLVARPVPRVGDPPPFEGHEVVLAVPVEGELVAAPTGEDATVVALTWDPVDLPDFLAYRIERRPDAEDGLWTTVAEFDDPEARDHADTVPEAGHYRYRLVVVRGDGDDGEVRGYSETRGVRADPADPGTFQPPPEPTPTPTPAPTPTPSATTSPNEPSNPGGPIGRPGDVAQGGTGDAETGTATTPPPPPAPVTVRPPAPAPAPQAPAVVPFNDGVFEELLPLGETETEFAVLESEAAFIDGSVREGGTLAVLTEEPRDREVVVALATGLLLLVAAGHVRRYLGAAERR